MTAYCDNEACQLPATTSILGKPMCDECADNFPLDEMLEYLDALRESGDINMFGASKYVQEMFELDKYTARAVNVHWMETFGERHKESSDEHAED